jgi:hypothetical protein
VATAARLFEAAGEKARIASDYLWRVDPGKALLNPLILVYRYEGRRINPDWNCFRMKGVDEGLSRVAWSRGFFGRALPVPPEYFCEGQIHFEYQNMPFTLSVNTSAWESMIDVLENQVRRLSGGGRVEYVLWGEDTVLEYRISSVPDLSCRRLERLKLARGRLWDISELLQARYFLIPSQGPQADLKVLAQLAVMQCKIALEVP